MTPLMYIIRKSFKNRLVQLKKKPGQLIAYLILMALIILPNIFKSKGTPENISPTIYGAGVVAFIILITVPDLLTSLNKGSTFFRGADVNLVFTAPLSPQDVLIYGFIRQMSAVALSLIFLLVQVPNLMRFSNVKGYAAFVIIGAVFILIFTNSIIKVLLYSIISKKEAYRKLANNIFKLLGLIFVILYFIQLFILKSPGDAILALVNNGGVKYIPVYGWIKEILMAAINGVNYFTWIYGGLTLLVLVICVVSLYKLDTDYYEDVLQATEKIEAAYTTLRNRGRGPRKFVTIPLGKIKKIKYKQKGEGATAIFYRQFLEAKKTGFGFVSMMTIVYAVIGVSVGLFIPEDLKDLRFILAFGVYALVIFSMIGRWQAELSMPYVFLIPANTVEKVIYSTLMDNIKNLLDGTVLFLSAGILFKSDPVIIILCILIYTSSGTIIIYGGLLTKRLVGSAENVVLSLLMRMGLLVLIIIPGAGVFAALSAAFQNYIPYIIFILYNLIFSGIIILLSKGIFENIELGS